jgi:hypothetical protein
MPELLEEAGHVDFVRDRFYANVSAETKRPAALSVCVLWREDVSRNASAEI